MECQLYNLLWNSGIASESFATLAITTVLRLVFTGYSYTHGLMPDKIQHSKEDTSL